MKWAKYSKNTKFIKYYREMHYGLSIYHTAIITHAGSHCKSVRIAKCKNSGVCVRPCKVFRMKLNSFVFICCCPAMNGTASPQDSSTTDSSDSSTIVY